MPGQDPGTVQVQAEQSDGRVRRDDDTEAGKATEKYSDKVKTMTKDIDKLTVEEVDPLKFKSSWARQMSQVSLEQQLKRATEAAEKSEKEGEEKKTTRRKKDSKPILLGDSMDRHDPMDWPWETSEGEWDGTEDKVERNREKKKRQRMTKEKKIEKATRVGKCTLGLGPIKLKSIEYFHTITGDYDEAKRMSAVEFLIEYLQFDNADMADMEITDTKISQKNDDILYVVFANPEIVKNVRRRVADCKNDTIRTRDYIPPQYFERYTALARYASDIRNNDKSIKTQIRFGDLDLVLLVKQRGTEEQLRPLNMREIEKEAKLPEIDYNLEWKRRPDRPAFRQISPQNRKINLKSLGGDGSNKKILQSPDNSPIPKKSRNQSSTSGSPDGSPASQNKMDTQSE